MLSRSATRYPAATSSIGEQLYPYAAPVNEPVRTPTNEDYAARRISEGKTDAVPEALHRPRRLPTAHELRTANIGLDTISQLRHAAPVAIDTTGKFWRGDDSTDLADYLREYQPGGYPAARIKKMICQRCDGKTFAVLADDEKGCAQTRCLTCGDHALIADSADYWQDADPEECACPCGGEAFQVAVGFALRTDGEVRWVSVGLRCTQDGTLGVYTDWKIDYSPTGHLVIGAT